jgi:capsular polysaccharide biosynthesis protein
VNKYIRRFGLLVLLTIVGGAAGAIYAALKTPTYTAKAYVVAIADKSEPMTALNFAQAYGRIATSGPVLAQARARLTDGTGLTDVRSATSPDAPVVEITATGPSATHTSDLANAVAGALADYGSLRSDDTDVKLSVLAAATVPVRPTSPKPPLELAVGAAGGLIIGGLATLAGVGRVSAKEAQVVTDVAEAGEEPAEKAPITGVAWVKPPPAITAYRSNGNGELTVVTDLTEPPPQPPKRAVGRAVVEGMEDD